MQDGAEVTNNGQEKKEKKEKKKKEKKKEKKEKKKKEGTKRTHVVLTSSGSQIGT